MAVLHPKLKGQTPLEALQAWSGHDRRWLEVLLCLRGEPDHRDPRAPDALAALRARVRRSRAPLFDPSALARSLEDHFEAWVDAR